MDCPSEKINAFGLDFSNLSLKLINLKKKGKRLSLSSFGYTELPEGLIDGGEIMDEQKLAQFIKQLLLNVKGEKLKSKYVIASLPEEKSFLDVLSLPNMRDTELESAVMFEAENYIPVPLSDVYFDFEKTATKEDDSKFREILITAVPKKIVDSYVNSLILAGLQPVAMEIESLAISRALINCKKNNTPALIIDLGESRTSFIIYSGRGVRFTSSIKISSDQFTKAISNALKISVQEAEIIKRRDGLDLNQKAFSALSTLLSELVSQIQSHLAYFYSQCSKTKTQKNELKIEKILLCGGGANLKGLVNFLSKELNIKVDLGNPWINILSYPLKEVPLLSFENSLTFVTALGLALRGVSKRKI